MPSNQQKLIEKAKFTYSTLIKAFEKQTKTVEDQGKKQVDSLKPSLKPKEMKLEETKPIDYDDYYINSNHRNTRQIKKIGFNNLTYIFKGKTAPTNFIGFKDPLYIFKSIYSGNIALEDVKKDQEKLEAELGRIKQGDPKNKSKEQFKVINNVINLYESREKVLQMFNNYPREKSRRIYESKQGK